MSCVSSPTRTSLESGFNPSSGSKPPAFRISCLSHPQFADKKA